MKCIYAYFFLFLFLIPLSHAQTIITDRPDQTESASVVGPSAFQIESGFVFHNRDGIKTTLLPTNLFRIGVNNFLELRVVHEYSIIDRSIFDQETYKGFNDLQAGFKLKLLGNANSTTRVALLSHLVIPSGDEPFFSNGDYGMINKLAVSHGLSDRWSIGYNLGYDFLTEDFFTYAVAVGYGITDKVSVYFEPFGILNGDVHEVNFDTGFTYLLKDNLQFDFSFGTGGNVEMNYLSIGFSWLLLKADEN